jgi:hypothetical protein
MRIDNSRSGLLELLFMRQQVSFFSSGNISVLECTCNRGIISRIIITVPRILIRNFMNLELSYTPTSTAAACPYAFYLLRT